MIGLAIAGGAYVSTVDEGTFWYTVLTVKLVSLVVILSVSILFWQLTITILMTIVVHYGKFLDYSTWKCENNRQDF